MIFSAQDHTLRDDELIGKTAAALRIARTSMIILFRRPDDTPGQLGTLEMHHCAELVYPSRRGETLGVYGIDLDAPLTARRYAFACVTPQGQLRVAGNSEPYKTLLWEMLTRNGAYVQRLANGDFQIMFPTPTDD